MKSDEEILDGKRERFSRALEKVLTKHKSAIRLGPKATLSMIRLFSALPGFFSDLNRLAIRDPKVLESITEADVQKAYDDCDVRLTLEE